MTRATAMHHLYGQRLSERTPLDPYDFLPLAERALLEAKGEDGPPAYLKGLVYVATVGPAPWRFVESLRATSPQLAYAAVRARHPELDGLPLRVDGPGGFHEGMGR